MIIIECGIIITKKTLCFQSTQHNLYFVTLLLNNTLHPIKNVLGYLRKHRAFDILTLLQKCDTFMKPIIFTLVGIDKPGLISDLAKTVYDMGGNWLGSNFSHMAGHFAGFVQVDLPLEKHQALMERLSEHPDLKIHLLPGMTETQGEQQTVQIDIMGNDNTGIVQELTQILSQFNLNIVKFDSFLESAPNWGGALFKAKAIIMVAADFDLETLRDRLESVANDLMVDIEIQ
jgi:glycine cleavage system regulatory protein